MAKQLHLRRARVDRSRRASTASPTRSRSRSAPRAATSSLDKKFGAPTVTHDGVTVAKEIELDDPFENMGAQLAQGSRHQDQRRRR